MVEPVLVAELLVGQIVLDMLGVLVVLASAFIITLARS
jgi:hypothetical protein